MASVPQSNLPLFYNDLMPLNSRDHSTWRSASLDHAKWLVGAHAIPLTVDEFVQAQRDFPIVFSSGDNPLPLALMIMSLCLMFQGRLIGVSLIMIMIS